MGFFGVADGKVARAVVFAVCSLAGNLALSPGAADAGPAALAPKAFRITVSGPQQPPVALHVEEIGRGRPIVLLHGLGASGYSWRRVAPVLARSFRVLTVDLRGHGRSDSPLDIHYAPAGQAELIRDLIKGLELRDVVLVGHSYGGLVTLVAALQERANRNSRIAKLVLLDAPAYPQPYSAGVRFLRRPVLPYVALTMIPPEIPVGLALMTEAIGMGHITQHDIDLYAEPLSTTGGRHALIQTARQIEPANVDTVVANYKTIAKPTALIWCRGDNVVPLSTGQRLARTLPRARLHVLETCDHVPPEQAPNETARIIARFASF